MEDETSASIPVVEKPRGMYPGKLDDKGRLKLPVNFQEYLKSFGEQKFFVTSLDRRLAQIYAMPVWRENEKFFDDFTEDPEKASNVAFTANDLGADTEMDGQGRILFNTMLRRELDLEGHELHMYAYHGRVEILSEAVYQERRRNAQQNPSGDVNDLRKKGLK